MTGIEIMIPIAGAALLAFSFFLKKEDKDAAAPETLLQPKDAAAQEDEIKRRVEEILEEKSLAMLSETEEKLSRISNDKIIAVDEFSSQVLQKIQNNNDEVIFLYDMFQKKEEEMKSALNKLERARRENKELLERLENPEIPESPAKKAAPKRTSRKVSGTQDDAANAHQEMSGTQADMLLKEDAKGTPEEAASAEVAPAKTRKKAASKKSATKAAPVENILIEKQRKEQILMLYREKKSIREISKQLSMGQGEVQLIVELYGKTYRN